MSLIASISQSSVSLALVATNRGCWTPHQVHRVWFFMLGKDSAPSGGASWCSCHESCVFRICSRISNFYLYAFYRYPRHDGSLYDGLLDSIATLMIRQFLSILVIRMLITVSGWSQSLLLIDMGVMLLILAICQVVGSWCAVPHTLLAIDSIFHSALQSTALSDVSFVLSSLCRSTINVRSTVFLEYRANCDSVSNVVRSFTWSIILKSVDQLVALDRALGKVIGRCVPTTALCSRSGDKQWFNASCGELVMLTGCLSYLV